MRFEELYERRQRRVLTMAEAAEMLGVTERTFRRWSGRYDAEGREGLLDRRIGRASARAVPVDEALRMVMLYETRYTGWTVKHFHERWQQAHGGTRSYTWMKKTLQAAGHVPRAPRRGAHRKKRPRKPLPGMMLHQDGSTHEWVPGCQWDLIVTLDDVTSEIYSAFFVEEEGTLSSFRGLREVMETQGLFSSLYTDRGSHYWLTEEAGGRVDKTRLTQVHRALQQVGITLIPAYSPEARGRSERVFRTLQDRLPLSGHAVSPGLQPALRGAGPRSRDRLRSVDRHEPRRDSLCARRAHRRQRQYRALSPPAVADPAGSAPLPLCEGHGPGPRISGWDAGRVPWSPVSGAV
jgi:transposase